MEPKHNNDYLPAVELPQPKEDSGPRIGAEHMPAAPETRGTSSSGAGMAVNPVVSQGAPTGILPIVSDTASQSQSTSATASMSGLIADDADLIEKEWVLKAKAIVAHTRNDPHQQNIEMTNIKADYLKKRYNKDLKTSGS